MAFYHFLYSNVNIWIHEINGFSKMTEFVNFEAVEDNVNDVIDVNEGEEM